MFLKFSPAVLYVTLFFCVFYQSEGKALLESSTGDVVSKLTKNSCTCVPHYLCKNNITAPANEDRNTDNREENVACVSLLEVCCPTYNKTTDAPTLFDKVSCGKRNPYGVGFKIPFDEDHAESQYGEFPWMIGVLRKDHVDGKDMTTYQCGGTLIHPQVVLTAAHCVVLASPNDRLIIRAGEWDIQKEREIYPTQEREISSSVIHPQYNRGRLYNDIALLFLENPVTIAANVDVLCLPSQDEVTDSSKCFISGWGKNVFGINGTYKIIPKKIGLPMVPRAKCQENLRKNTKLGRYFELHQSFVCAGGESGKDACKGDGGSPLVCPIRRNGNEERYAQVGIVAWGSGCGEASVPGVYVNVALFREWIDVQMKLKNL